VLSFKVMMRLAVLSLLLGGCAQPPPELPWLHGVEPSALSTSVIPGRNPDVTSLACSDDAFARIELVTELTADPGLETIRASLAHGVQVHGRAGALLLQAVGEPCDGPADTITALAVAPPHVIVVVAQGEAAAPATRVSVLRPGPQRRLDRVFTGVIATRRDDEARTGMLAFAGDRLIHTDPAGVVSIHVFDPRARAYVAEPAGGTGQAR